MGRWSEAGERIPTTLFEAAAWQRTIKVTCQARGCGHFAIFQPHALWWLFQRKRWNEEFRHAHRRFVCQCGARRAKIEPCRNPITIDALPLPPEHEWKRAVSRFRS